MTSAFERLPLCDRVRRSCGWVMTQAREVAIDDDALAHLAPTLEVNPPDVAGTTGVLRRDEIDEATLVFALDAINFGSGYHDIVRKLPGRSGSRTMATALERYVAWTGPLHPARLQKFTTADCSQIFGQDLDGGALEELMSLFASALVDLGVWLEHQGGVQAVLDRADGSAETLAELLTDMVFYRDVERYRDHPVWFYKRAQITAADLARRVRPFRDLHRLTAFADNLVPHVLRVSGVLRFSPALTATIERGELLEPGSEAEIEIRAAGVEGVERLAALTGHRPMDIDAALWTLGATPSMKAVRRHRARSVFY